MYSKYFVAIYPKAYACEENSKYAWKNTGLDSLNAWPPKKGGNAKTAQ